MDYDDLQQLLYDAIESQDINLYKRIVNEINRRTALYE